MKEAMEASYSWHGVILRLLYNWKSITTLSYDVILLNRFKMLVHPGAVHLRKIQTI